MKKKILFVINSLGLGGAEKSLTSLLNTIDFHRYEVDLLMFRPTGMFMKLLPGQVHILPELEFLRSNRFLKEQLKYPRYFIARMRASIGLRKNSRNHKLHDAQCYWKYAGKAFNKLSDTYDAAIAWGQGNPTHYVIEKVQAKKKIAFINADYILAGHNKKFDYPYYEKYDFIVAVSDKLREIMISVFPNMRDKIKTIYDVNNADLIEKMAMESNPFKEEKRVKIVTAGRLVPPKNHLLLVKTAKELKNRNFNFVWYVVGEGDERAQIEKWMKEYDVEDRVVLTGAKDNPYVYMKNADIYVQTSIFEGYCLTLAEARILNVPVISTNFDVVYDQIRDEENGLVVEMKPDALADAIMRMWSDDKLRRHIIETLKQEKKGNIEEIEKLYSLME